MGKILTGGFLQRDIHFLPTDGGRGDLKITRWAPENQLYIGSIGLQVIIPINGLINKWVSLGSTKTLLIGVFQYNSIYNDRLGAHNRYDVLAPKSGDSSKVGSPPTPSSRSLPFLVGANIAENNYLNQKTYTRKSRLKHIIIAIATCIQFPIGSMYRNSYLHLVDFYGKCR